MTDHLVMPPIDPRKLAGAFDVSFLDDVPLTPHTVLDCGTAASDAVIQRCNAHALATEADPAKRQAQLYVRPPAATAVAGASSSSAALQPQQPPAHSPHAALVGIGWRERVLSAVEEAMAQWREYVAGRGIDPADDSNAWRHGRAGGKRGGGAKAAQDWPVGPSDPTMRRVLAHLPTEAQMKASFEARCATAAILSNSANEDTARAHLFGLLERKQMEDRQNAVTPSLRCAAVPGAPDVDLESHTYPPLSGAHSVYSRQTMVRAAIAAGATASSSSASSSSSSPSSSASHSAFVAPPDSDGSEVVFRVSLYSSQYVRRESEYEVLGSNTLSQLRDRFYCKSDGVMAQAARQAWAAGGGGGGGGGTAGDGSEDDDDAMAAGPAAGASSSSSSSSPDGPPQQSASLLYIEGTLYDDRRPGREMLGWQLQQRGLSAPVPASASAPAVAVPARTHAYDDDDEEDDDDAVAPAAPVAAAAAAPAPYKYLSESILTWFESAAQQGRDTGWGRLVAGDMAATRFIDLKPRLGAHYLFAHAGDCEHIMVFTDARLLSPLPGVDMRNARYYPRHVFQAKIRRRRCQACDVVWASLMSYGDRLAETNPAYWCEHCYRASHTVSGPDGEPMAMGGPDAPQVFPYTHD